MKRDFTQRFGFLVNDVAKLHGEAFDRLARERIGLSRAQCRLLGVLAMNGDEAALSQTELAQRLGLSTMAVATLCDRMVAAGWIRREPSPTDRRAWIVRLTPKGRRAFETMAEEHERWILELFSSMDEKAMNQVHAHLGELRVQLVRQDQNPQENG